MKINIRCKERIMDIDLIRGQSDKGGRLLGILGIAGILE